MNFEAKGTLKKNRGVHWHCLHELRVHVKDSRLGTRENGDTPTLPLGYKDPGMWDTEQPLSTVQAQAQIQNHKAEPQNTEEGRGAT